MRWMFARRIIGGKHTPEGRVLREVAHLSKEEQRKVKDEWEMCIKQLQWVLRMKKTGEDHVCLNPKTLSEMLKVIG